MSRIAAKLRRVCQAPKVRAVKSKLHKFRLRVFDKGQIAGIGVVCPMRDHPRELQTFGRVLAGAANGRKQIGDSNRKQDRNDFWHTH